MTEVDTDIAPAVVEIKVEPNSRPQELFFQAREYEVLFGGAAGGGKSWALVAHPMQFIHLEGFTSIIFRRTYPELEGSIFPYCRKYYPLAGGEWHDQRKLWTFPSGATIRLGYLKDEGDWLNYQGHEYAGMYFDELTNIRWDHYVGLKPWNRSRCIGVRSFIRATSNPGGPSHSQVKAYFVETCPAEKDGPERYSELARMRWQPMGPGDRYWDVNKDTGHALSRRFIPSRVFDNEDLLRNNPNYLAQLLAQPQERRKAYLEGDWDVFSGQFFSMWLSDLHVIDPIERPPNPDWPVVGCIDYGERTVLEVQFRDYEGTIINFAECYTVSETPAERFNAMADMLLERKLFNLRIIYDTNMDISLRNYVPGADKTPAQFAREVFKDRMGDKAPHLSVVSKSTVDRRGYRAVCNEAMKQAMYWKRDESGEMKARPKFLVTRDCQHLRTTLPELVHDPDSVDGLDFDQKIGEDDPYDSAKMALMFLRTPTFQETRPPVPHATIADLSGKEFTDSMFSRRMDKVLRRGKRVKADSL